MLVFPAFGPRGYYDTRNLPTSGTEEPSVSESGAAGLDKRGAALFPLFNENNLVLAVTKKRMRIQTVIYGTARIDRLADGACAGRRTVT
jgi:hypothetical protein